MTGTATPSLERYESLLQHAERGLELAGRGDLAALTVVTAEWDQLTAGLPTDPPPGAGDLLQRAHLLHERTHIELMRLREALLADVSSTSRGRRAADGYAGQLRRRPRLDRSA